MEELACQVERLVYTRWGRPGEPSSSRAMTHLSGALYSHSSSIRLGKVSKLRNNESSKSINAFTTGMITKNVQKLSQFCYFLNNPSTRQLLLLKKNFFLS